MSLSWALTQQGTIGEALVEAERAVPALEGEARARMQMQRALILQRLGRFGEALDGYRRPLAAFRRVGRRAVGGAAAVQPRRPAGPPAARWARPRPTCCARRRCTSRSARRSPRPRSATTSAGSPRGAATCPPALSLFDRVEAEYRAHDVPLALLFMDRCDVLLSARLAAEARSNALAAVAELEAARPRLRPRRGAAARRPRRAAVRRHRGGPRPRRPGRPRLRPPAPPDLGRAGAGRGGAEPRGWRWSAATTAARERRRRAAERRRDAATSRRRRRARADSTLRRPRGARGSRMRWRRRGGRSGRSMPVVGASRRWMRG